MSRCHPSTKMSFTSFAAYGRRGPPSGQAPRKVQNCPTKMLIGKLKALPYWEILSTISVLKHSSEGAPEAPKASEGAGARIREFDSEELIDSGPGPGHWANFGHTQRSLR